MPSPVLGRENGTGGLSGFFPLRSMFRRFGAITSVANGETAVRIFDPEGNFVGFAIRICENNAGWLIDIVDDYFRYRRNQIMTRPDCHRSVLRVFQFSGPALLKNRILFRVQTYAELLTTADPATELENEACNERQYRQASGDQTRLLFMQDEQDQDRDHAVAEDGGDQIPREIQYQGMKIIRSDQDQPRQGNGENQRGGNIVPPDIPGDICSRESRQRPDCPVRPVIIEQAKAQTVEGHLDQIDQGLGDQEIDKSLTGCLQRFVAVHDNNDGQHDPGFKGYGDLPDRVPVRHHLGDDSRDQTGNHCKQDQPGPCHFDSAEDFLTHSVLPTPEKCSRPCQPLP